MSQAGTGVLPEETNPMIDLINQHRAPLRAESESLDEQLKELDKQKRILGARKTVVTSKLALLNEMASDLEKARSAPKQIADHIEQTSQYLAEDAALNLLRVDSAESQEAPIEQADTEAETDAQQWREQLLTNAEGANLPKWAPPSPEAFPFSHPAMPFTLGSLASTGVLGPFPVWMMGAPHHLLGNLALRGYCPPFPSFAAQAATPNAMARTSAQIAEDCALSLLRATN